MEFASWINQHLGNGAVEILKERVHDLSIKYSKNEKKEIAKHYKAEFEKMRKQRENGKIKRLEFIGYD